MKRSTVLTSGIVAAAVPLIFATPSLAAEVNTGYFGNVAIKGYDTVAYFTMNQAVRGTKDISTEWLGAKWNFSSEAHRELFESDPIRYAPQYGGYCADGLAYGDATTNIDPSAWRIIDGKLYINSDQGAAAELEELEGQLEKTAQNWPAVRERLQQPPE